MSQFFREGRLSFDFPDTWVLCRPQDTSYYKRHFQNFCNGSKEMDFLAFDPSAGVLWLIEIKDYRVNRRTKQEDLADEVALKTRDVLAMLPIAGIRDNGVSNPGSVQVRDFWQRAMHATNIRVVLHCELPASPSRLFPGIKDAANLQTKLTQKLHCVDPRAIFTNLAQHHHFSWTVQ